MNDSEIESVVTTFDWIFNFDSKFIDYVWKDDPNLKEHLKSKFSGFCKLDGYGSANAVCTFFMSLTLDHKIRLAKYIIGAADKPIVEDPGELPTSFNHELENFQ